VTAATAASSAAAIVETPIATVPASIVSLPAAAAPVALATPVVSTTEVLGMATVVVTPLDVLGSATQVVSLLESSASPSAAPAAPLYRMISAVEKAPVDLATDAMPAVSNDESRPASAATTERIRQAALTSLALDLPYDLSIEATESAQRAAKHARKADQFEALDALLAGK
jgi:hypothetical protein